MGMTKILKVVMVIGASVALAAMISACNQSGTAERAGKKIDETVEKAGQGIDRAKDKLEEQVETAGEAVSDSAITTKVKAAILAEPGLRSLQISVETTDGKVTLVGTVDSQQAIDSAKSVAGTVAGVKSVDNQLSLKSAK
jgi:hyperosmotically inducible protein